MGAPVTISALSDRFSAIPPLRAVAALCLAIAVPLLASGSAAAQDGAATRALGDYWQGAGAAPEYPGAAAAKGYALRSKRHQAFMQGGVPVEYRNAKSPYPLTRGVIADGAAVYGERCASCHGAEGLGDGRAAMDLRPTPAFLAFLIDSPDLVDEYLMWTVAEGGAEFGSDMPAFRDTLTDRQIWQVVAYMRAGFPQAGD